MKFHFKIPEGLKVEVNKELREAQKTFQKGELQTSWRHLERAHILGQAHPFEHTQSHWHMMCFAFKIKNTKEIAGQIPRLLIGGIKSFVGEIPLGNTGGANVPPLKPLEIPDDLKRILEAYK
ncbi:MAG: DUF3703 domain-containing protein [Bacteroidota bacterium]